MLWRLYINAKAIQGLLAAIGPPPFPFPHPDHFPPIPRRTPIPLTPTLPLTTPSPSNPHPQSPPLKPHTCPPPSKNKHLLRTISSFSLLFKLVTATGSYLLNPVPVTVLDPAPLVKLTPFTVPGWCRHVNLTHDHDRDGRRTTTTGDGRPRRA